MGNDIHPTALIVQSVVMGDRNYVGEYTCIGQAPQLRVKDGLPRQTIIGNGNIIRELVTIHEGARIGDNNFIMAHTHIGHDMVIADSVTITGAKIAGHVQLDNLANIGLNATIHQRIHVGSLAMVGMGAVVVDDVPPFTTVAGNPARIIGWNTLGMVRAGYNTSMIIEMIYAGKHPVQTAFVSSPERTMKRRGE